MKAAVEIGASLGVLMCGATLVAVGAAALVLLACFTLLLRPAKRTRPPYQSASHSLPGRRTMRRRSHYRRYAAFRPG
jgi:hypothetical protein